MKRINGFLDLDDYFYKIEDRHPENINYLYDEGLVQETDIYNHYWLNIEGEKYYFKESRNHYNELIAEEVAKLLGQEAAEYDLAYFNGIKGVITKNFKKEDVRYVSGAEILKSYYESDYKTVQEMGLTDDWVLYFKAPYYSAMNNLEIIWQALEHRYKNVSSANVEHLMCQIVDLYIYNILIGHNDRISLNWEIEEGDEIKLAPIFDNEDSFFEESEVHMSTNFNDNRLQTQDSLAVFLSISSEEFVSRFIEKFDMLTEEVLIRIFDRVEKRIETKIPQKYKDYISKNFGNNRKSLEEIVNNYRTKIVK